MSILLIILKIIGILLLAVFVLTAVILFHPIFYRIKGELQEEVSLQGYFWWLFQILRIEFKIENNNFRFRFRIFGFSRGDGKEEEQEKEIEHELPSIPTQEQNVWEDEIKTEQTKPDVSARQEGVRKRKNHRKNSKKEKKSSPKENNSFGEKFGRFREEIIDSGNRQAVFRLWKELCYLLAHLKPRYLEAEIAFSAGDPSVTGEVTGALSLIPVIYRFDTHIYPDFLSEEFYIRGSLNMRGHMALFPFVVSLVRLIRDKNIKRLYNKFRK